MTVKSLTGVSILEALDGTARQGSQEFEAIPTVAELDAVADQLHLVANDLNFARLDAFLKDALERSATARASGR
jgi:hypothetical protein